MFQRVQVPQDQQGVRPGLDTRQDRPQLIQVDQHPHGVTGRQTGDMSQIGLHPAVQGLLVKAGGQDRCIAVPHVAPQNIPLAQLPQHSQPVVLAVGPQ